MRKVNLGCGPYKEPGFINIDINPRQAPDIVRDITRGLPFDTNSTNEVLASHVLEHLDPDNFLFVMGEIYRILINGGSLRVIVPIGIVNSVDHKMIFVKDSFDIFGRDDAALYFNMDFKWKLVEKSESICSYTNNPLLHITLVAIK